MEAGPHCREGLRSFVSFSVTGSSDGLLSMTCARDSMATRSASFIAKWVSALATKMCSKCSHVVWKSYLDSPIHARYQVHLPRMSGHEVEATEMAEFRLSRNFAGCRIRVERDLPEPCSPEEACVRAESLRPRTIASLLST